MQNQSKIKLLSILKGKLLLHEGAISTNRFDDCHSSFQLAYYCPCPSFQTHQLGSYQSFSDRKTAQLIGGIIQQQDEGSQYMNVCF